MITVQEELRTLIRIHVDGIPAHTLRALLMSSRHGPYDHDAIEHAMALARAEGFAFIDEAGRWHQTPFAAAQDRHAEAVAITPTRADRAVILIATTWHWFSRELWPRISHAAIALALILVTACACIVSCAVTAHGVEVPDRLVAAICAVETGTEWRAIGDVRGKWSRGDIGEVSPWQIAPSVLRDLKAYDRRFRIHADPVLAESLVRLWLSRLYDSTGSWSETVAAYHAGIAGRHRSYARDYARRVLNIAETL